MNDEIAGETAIAWASAENAAREDITPADEIRAFGRMKTRGASVPEIALAFAVTEARVYQRLALANLPEPVLDALAAGEISLGTAKAFTLSDDDGLDLRAENQSRKMGARLQLTVPSWEGPTGPASVGSFLFIDIIATQAQKCPAAGQKDRPPAPPPGRRYSRGSTAKAVQWSLMQIVTLKPLAQEKRRAFRPSL